MSFDQSLERHPDMLAELAPFFLNMADGVREKEPGNAAAFEKAARVITECAQMLRSGRDGESYLIWSNQHRAWWNPASAGYTMYAELAGRYSRDEAIKICNGRDGWRVAQPPDEIPVRESDILECVQANN